MVLSDIMKPGFFEQMKFDWSVVPCDELSCMCRQLLC